MLSAWPEDGSDRTFVPSAGPLTLRFEPLTRFIKSIRWNPAPGPSFSAKHAEGLSEAFRERRLGGPGGVTLCSMAGILNGSQEKVG
jgi:hypothetical protein